jgi:hypothetical protein
MIRPKYPLALKIKAKIYSKINYKIPQKRS